MAPAVAAVPAEPEFDECFRQHYARLVRALGAGADGAEEAVQEAFVEAHLRWRKVARLDDPVGWVRRVAIRRILNQQRSRHRRDRALTRLGAAAALGATEPATGVSADLVAAVRSLPARQRLTLALHYLEGLTVAEVAEAMGVQAGTVKSQLHDARRKLRDLLEVRDDE